MRFGSAKKAPEKTLPGPPRAGKSEARSPRSEGNPKSEIRRTKGFGGPSLHTEPVRPSGERLNWGREASLARAQALGNVGERWGAKEEGDRG